MAEQVDLTTPQPVGTMSSIVWDRIQLQIRGEKIVTLQWQDNLGRGFSATYPTPIPIYPPGFVGPKNTVTGQQMLSTINTGNHTTTSMAKKLFTQIQTDGYIAAGPVTGTPE